MEEIYLYIVIGVLVISNIFFIIRGTQLVRQIETIANDMDNLNELSIGTLENMMKEMKELDIKGSFESDDEVGVVFKELKDTIEKYKNNL
jgi:predicted PurR-regulated permease PerM|tara:strand:+ start:71 stop:340 length:270 start_codon:yes stop_codon:yes gene_type:complete